MAKEQKKPLNRSDIERIVFKHSANFIFQVLITEEILNEEKQFSAIEIAEAIKEKYKDQKIDLKRVINISKLSKTLRAIHEYGLLSHHGMEEVQIKGQNRGYDTRYSLTEEAKRVLQDEKLKEWLLSPPKNRFLNVLDKIRRWNYERISGEGKDYYLFLALYF